MKRHYDPLLDLIQVLEDGIEFYQIALRQTRSSVLYNVFTKVSDIREFALAYLHPYVDHDIHGFDKSLTYHGTLANRYAPLLDKIVEDTSLELVCEVENHLIDAMVATSENCHNALVQCILKDLAPRIRQNFEQCSAETKRAQAA